MPHLSNITDRTWYVDWDQAQRLINALMELSEDWWMIHSGRMGAACSECGNRSSENYTHPFVVHAQIGRPQQIQRWVNG